jgi:aryl-alcohol dehydrogenase-like predicted oxidoreductase
VLHQVPDLVPIPGTKRRRFLEENVAAADVRLAAADVARLDTALPPEAIAGPRYNESMMSYIDR